MMDTNIRCLLCVWTLSCLSQAVTKEQRIYVTVFTQNYHSKSGQMHLYISSSRPKPVTVEVIVPFLNSRSPFVNLTLSPGRRERVDIPSNIQMPTGTLTSDRIVRVISDDDVTVMALNVESSNMDMYQVRDELQLGKEYIVVTPQTVSGGSASTVGIVSPYSDVEVKVTLPSSFVTLSAKIDDTLQMLPRQFSVTLKENQTFQIQSVDDLSGTYILSDKPIAVLAGVNRTATQDSLCLDGQVTQLLSVDKLGTQYIVFGFSEANKQDYIHVVSTKPDTEVTFDGTTTTTLSKEREITRLMINRNRFHLVKATFPSVVAVSTASGKSPVKGDPSFYSLQPLPLTGLQYTFTVPDDTPFSGGVIYLILMVDNDSVDDILLDDMVIAGAQWQQVAGTNISACYYLVTDNMTTRVLRHRTGKPFAAYLQGYDICQAYSLLFVPYNTYILPSQSCGHQDIRRDRRKNEGRRMTSQRMKFLTVEFLSACFSYCLKYTECIGVNFSTHVVPGETNCQLLFTETDGQVDTGDWTFYSLTPN